MGVATAAPVTFTRLRRLDTWGVRVPAGIEVAEGDVVDVTLRNGGSRKVVLGPLEVEFDDAALWQINEIATGELAEKPKLEPGVYESEEGVFVVRPNREGSAVYAKRLVEAPDRLTEAGERAQIDFEYAPGAIYRLRPEHRMDLERAKELTIRYGRCIVCGRHLKAADSVERGIGPVCRKLVEGR